MIKVHENVTSSSWCLQKVCWLKSHFQDRSEWVLLMVLLLNVQVLCVKKSFLGKTGFPLPSVAARWLVRGSHRDVWELLATPLLSNWICSGPTGPQGKSPALQSERSPRSRGPEARPPAAVFCVLTLLFSAGFFRSSPVPHSYTPPHVYISKAFNTLYSHPRLLRNGIYC